MVFSLDAVSGDPGGTDNVIALHNCYNPVHWKNICEVMAQIG
jgi:hypothetical protein